MTNETVLGHLKLIEERHKVRVLFAVESGSRAWGFESADSDYDVRFVYARPSSWYCSIAKREYHLDAMNLVNASCDVSREEALTEFGFPLYDYAGVDLLKLCSLMSKGNCAVQEWLGSPIVYSDSCGFSDYVNRNIKLFRQRPAFYHYRNMAKADLTAYINVKKLLYSFRSLAAAYYISEFSRKPPVVVQDLVNELGTLADVGQSFVSAYAELRDIKMSMLEQDRVDYTRLSCAPFIRWLDACISQVHLPEEDLDLNSHLAEFEYHLQHMMILYAPG